MKNANTIEDSVFYKSNLKIQNNLWKVYTITLAISFIVVAVQRF